MKSLVVALLLAGVVGAIARTGSDVDQNGAGAAYVRNGHAPAVNEGHTGFFDSTFESGGWAMMLSGLALVGVVIYRRSRGRSE